MVCKQSIDEVFLQSVTPSGGYWKCAEAKINVAEGTGDLSITIHTVDMFGNPDIFAIPTLWIW